MLLIYRSGSKTLLIFTATSYRLNVIDIVFSDFLLSDLKPILFSLSLLELSQLTIAPVTLSRFYSLQFSTNFDLFFAELCSHLHLDQHFSLLNFFLD